MIEEEIIAELVGFFDQRLAELGVDAPEKLTPSKIVELRKLMYREMGVTKGLSGEKMISPKEIYDAREKMSLMVEDVDGVEDEWHGCRTKRGKGIP